MCVYIDINSHIYIVCTNIAIVLHMSYYIYIVLYYYICVYYVIFLENATTNAHGLYTELPDKLKGNHSII